MPQSALLIKKALWAYEVAMLINQSKSSHETAETTPKKKAAFFRSRVFWITVVCLLWAVPLLGILLLEPRMGDFDVTQYSSNLWRYLMSRQSVADLPGVKIDAKYKHVHKLQQRREQALKQGQVAERDFLPAQLQYQGETMPIDLRLKPGAVDSLKTDQWAYQIEIENDDRPFGMKQFSLYKPSPMAFLAEQAWLEHLREEGLIARRTRFVAVTFNGGNSQRGLVVEDEFSKELIKASGRPEGLFIAYSQSDSGRYALATTRDDHIDKYFGLQRQRASAIALLQGFLEGTYAAEQVFDIPATAKFLAIASLWPQSAVLSHPQAYFYYNPITAKLEPVGFHVQPDAQLDTQSSSPSLASPSLDGLPSPPTNGWAVQLLRDPAIATAYRRERQRLTQPDYWAQIQPKLTAKLRTQQAPLQRPFQADLVATVLQQALNLRLSQTDTLWASAHNFLAVASTHTKPRSFPPSQRETQAPLLAPTIPALLAQHPFLRWDEAQRALTILPGEWAVKGDLITPAGVAIQASAGTQLKFEPKAIFLAKGPLQFWGTAEAPIALSAQQKSWGGLEVWQAQQPSLLKQVSIEQTLGGSFFYNSPVSFIHSRILGSEARDGLKLLHSPFVISNSQFQNCADDAIDTETAPGHIDSSQFRNIGGDGIDISDSQVTVENVDLAQVADKGISAGQNSQLTANNVVIRGGAIAIGTLDGSTATLNNIKIFDMDKAGLTAFTDRLGFAPAFVMAKGIEMHNTPYPTIVQTRSQITLNGKAIAGDDQTTHLLNTQNILNESSDP
jgi:hypothetical protein